MSTHLPLFPESDAAPHSSQEHGAGVGDTESTPEFTPLDLPLMPPVRHGAPDTSHDAAASMIAAAKRQRADVFRVILAAGEHGATDAEIEAATGIRAQSVSPRRGELRDKLRLIKWSGRKRPTPSGRSARVWVVVTGTDTGEGRVAP